MPRNIEDDALLGDTQTVAKVSPAGSTGWLCLPRFESDPCSHVALVNTASLLNDRLRARRDGRARHLREEGNGE